jgi:hypothetical protein
MEPKLCRERARECRLLAQSCEDPLTTEALHELAGEFEAAAAEFDTGGAEARIPLRWR